MDLTLTRIFYGAFYTLGAIVIPTPAGDRLFYSMEDAWKGNARLLSCIPDGTYRCRPRRFNRGGYDAIEITGVPGRDTILFHRGNTADDVTGCIVLGSSIGVLNGRVGVLGSGHAFAALMAENGQKEWELTIRPMPPQPGARL